MAQYLTPEGVELFYTDAGEGSPVLLLHGWTCDSHDWSWLIPVLLERGHRVIALDHRGHGRSGTPAGGYTPANMAEDAAGLLRHLGLEQVLVAGHSMGTIVGSVLSIEHPGLVTGLILVDPPYNRTEEMVNPVIEMVKGPEPQAAVAAVFRAAFYTPDVPAWLPMWHERRALGTPAHVVRDCFLALYQGPDAIGRAENAATYLQARKCPSLAVYAAEYLTFVERQLPQGKRDEIAIVEGGHWLHQQKPDAFHAIVLSWLDKHGF